MSGFNYVFDATQYAPEQGSPTHPIGKFSATISNTAIQPTRDNDGGMFVVEFTTEAGKISNRYNLWNQSQKAVDIAHKQLSALCHAVGVFRVDMQNEGAALRNARLMIEVGKQKDSEYTEVKRVFDANGNEPGKAGAPAAAPAPSGPAFGAPAAAAAAPAGNWSGQPAAPAPGPQGGWGGQPNPAPADHGQPPANAWGGAPARQPGPAPSGAPGAAPWGGGQPTQAAPAPAPSGAHGWSQGGQPAPAAAPWGQH